MDVIRTPDSMIEFEPMLCQTCGMPYAWADDDFTVNCEEHEEARAEGYAQDVDYDTQRAMIEGALSMFTAMRQWCAYDVEPNFDAIVCQQIRTYQKALQDLVATGYGPDGDCTLGQVAPDAGGFGEWLEQHGGER